MRPGKRWTLVSEEEAEALRAKRPLTRGSMLRAAAVTFMMSGPLVACNQKGGWEKDEIPLDTDTDTDTDIDTDVDTDTDLGDCVVQPDCCEPLACVRESELDSGRTTCDTDCERGDYSCDEDEDGNCLLVGPDTDAAARQGLAALGEVVVPLYCEVP